VALFKVRVRLNGSPKKEKLEDLTSLEDPSFDLNAFEEVLSPKSCVG
jgi:hypothetical protein